MKTVILCGGLGTRLAEETGARPKPMVEISGKPMLWHILSIYSQYQYHDFVLACGYKSEIIKRYFLNYHEHASDIAINLATRDISMKHHRVEPWQLKLKDTGLHTLTGGRLLRLRDELAGEERFMLTYGDGVSDINIDALLAFHKQHGKLATLTAVRPPARFGHLTIKNKQVIAFNEKSQLQSGWINGGFFVFEKDIFNYLQDDQTILEREPLERLAQEGQLMVHQHEGFWQCMDTVRDRQYLEHLAQNGMPWLAESKTKQREPA